MNHCVKAYPRDAPSGKHRKDTKSFAHFRPIRL